MSRRRVLWLSHFVPYPPHSGSRIRSYHLLRELAAEFDVELFMIDPRPPTFPGLDVEGELRALRAMLARVERFASVRERAVSRRGWLALRSLVDGLPVTTRLLENPELASRLTEEAGRRSYAAVHLDTIDLAPYAQLFQGTPVVLNHHNVESSLMKRQARARPFPLRTYLEREARKLESLERRMCPQAALNLTCSETDSAILRSICPDATYRVVPNGVDVKYFSADGRERTGPAASLIWVGAMSWYPNRDAIEYFLDAIWPLVAKSRPDLRFLLVGGSPPESCRTAVAADRIRATGYVEDIRPLVAQADVYVVPIRVGGGTRLKIMDAFASGIPVVSTPVGCEGIEARDGHHLLVREDPASFADAVLTLLKDPDQRARLAANARRLVEERYDWATIGRGLRESYSAL